MDNFDFNLIDDFLGYVSSKDKTNVAHNALIRGSFNVYKKLSGTIANRFGLKRRGTADSTLAGIKSAYVWLTSLGTTRPLRVDANGRLQVEYLLNGTYTWYTLLTDATHTRYVFDSWWDNSAKKDKLLFVKHDSNLCHWSGGIGVIGATTVNTISLLDSTYTWAQLGFEATGSIIINGNTYAYTGGTGTTTLTGVTADPRGEASGSVALQTVITETDKPSSGFINDFIKVIGNQVHVGSYTSRVVYISSSVSYTDYTVPTPAIAGSPELLTLDSAPVGIGVRQGNANIFAGTQDRYIVSFSFQSIWNGSAYNQIRQTNVDKRIMPVLFAPKSHEFIDSIGDDIVIFSQDNQLRLIGTFKDIFGADKYPSLSQVIQDELKDVDFAGGHIKAIGEFIYITSPNTGIHYMHQTREVVTPNGLVEAERLWHPPQISNISRFVAIDGIVYGHSNANPQIYQIWDTNQWHDDGPDGELIYSCVARFAYQHLALNKQLRRQGLLSFDKLFTEGYMTEGSIVGSRIFFNYQGSENRQELVVNDYKNPATFYLGSNYSSIGNDSMGDNPLGNGLVTEANGQELLPKFYTINKTDLTNCFEFAIEYFSDDADSRWEILCFGTNGKIAEEQQATFIQK